MHVTRYRVFMDSFFQLKSLRIMLVLYIALGAFVIGGGILLAADRLAEGESNKRYY